MLYLLSPAKSLDHDRAVPPDVAARATTPIHMARAAELIALLRRKTPAQLATLMSLSDDLAALNARRYRAWSRRNGPRNSRPAAWAFDGDVYGGLDATRLSLDDLDWAQRHLVILSGLYGLLRPLDRLQPYRLEMGTALANPAGRDLYAYWGDTLARALDRRLARRAEHAHPVIVNLASQEYFRAVARGLPASRVVDCQFEDWKDGRYRIISFFAKRARGLMARWAIRQRVDTPARLAGFTAEGYAFDAADSSPDRLVFRRRAN